MEATKPKSWIINCGESRNFERWFHLDKTLQLLKTKKGHHQLFLTNRNKFKQDPATSISYHDCISGLRVSTKVRDKELCSLSSYKFCLQCLCDSILYPKVWRLKVWLCNMVTLHNIYCSACTWSVICAWYYSNLGNSFKIKHYC